MKHRFNFGPKAERFAMRPPEQDWTINILEGAVRSGKTWCLHIKALYCCGYLVGGHKVITGVSKQSIYNNVLHDLFDIVGARNYSYNRASGQLKLFNSDWLVIGAKDEGSERYIRGLTVGVALCDEISLMPRSFFHMLLSRMSPEGARLYGTTNPDSPYHWLKAEYLDNQELRTNEILWSDHFTMSDNPNLTARICREPKAAVHGFLLQAVYRRSVGHRRRRNLSEIPGPTNCCTTSKTSRKAFGREAAMSSGSSPIDYGTTNPMVFLDIYDDGQLFWIVREYYWDSMVEMRQKTDAEYADDLMKFIGPNNDAKVIIDPSAASFKAEMTKRGIWHVDADNDVNEGIRISSMVLNQRLVRFCRQTAKKTIQEMQSYAWDPKAAQRGEEKPLKIHDHGPDAFRYFAKNDVPYWRLAS